MTQAQRNAEAKFWRGIAAIADTGVTMVPPYGTFLCHHADEGTARRTAMAIFSPTEYAIAFHPWWNSQKWPNVDIYGPPEGRVLAACLLADMVEAGDLDDIYDEATQ